MTEPTVEDVQKALDKTQELVKGSYKNGFYLVALNVLGLAAAIFFGTASAVTISVSVVALLYGVGLIAILVYYGCLYACQFFVKNASLNPDLKEQSRLGFAFMMDTTLTIYRAGIVAIIVAAVAGLGALSLSMFFRQ